VFENSAEEEIRTLAILSVFEKFRENQWNSGKFSQNVLETTEEQLNFRIPNFSRFCRIIGWLQREIEEFFFLKIIHVISRRILAEIGH
jgi:hypothetical protein